MSTRTPAAIKQAVAKTVNEARSLGEPVNELVELLAKQHNVGRTSVYRWADGEHLVSHDRVALTREQLMVIASCQGSRRAAHEILTVEDGLTLSYSQFCRRLANVDTDLRVAVTEGVQAMQKAGLYNVQQDQYERGDAFGFDHTEIPVWYLDPGDTKPRKMWISIALDWATDFIFRPTFTEGDEALGGDPNTTTIVSMVTSIMLGREFDGHMVGGIPSLWVFDNAATHFAEEVQNGLAHTGTTAHAIRPGSPWENGPTENAVNVLERLIWKQMPGYTHHLSTRYGKGLWENDDLMSSDELIARTVAGVDRINRERPMKRLGGKTRFEAWKEAESLLRFVEPDQVRHLFVRTARQKYKIHKSGIHFNNVWYTSRRLAGNVGRKVEVRHLKTDPSFIDVYLDGELLCTATPAKNLSATERSIIARQRRANTATAERIQKASKKRARDIADREQAKAILDGDNGTSDSDTEWNGWEVGATKKQALETTDDVNIDTLVIGGGDDQ